MVSQLKTQNSKLKTQFMRLCLAGLLLAPLAVVGGRAERARAEEITFPQKGFTLSDAHGFLPYWRAPGGPAPFGYSLSREAVEVSPTNGRVYITQWFERNRFEYHPENSDPQFQVLLGLLGHDLVKGRESEEPFRRVPGS